MTDPSPSPERPAEPGQSATTSSPAAARAIVVRAPASGEVLGEVPALDAAAVQSAVRRARGAQRAWARLPVEARAALMRRYGELLVERADELVEVLVREAGKVRNEALAHEVLLVAQIAHWACEHAPRILADRPLELALFKHRRAYVRYAPMGVVGVISPWNFPLVIPLGSVFEALLAGNAAVVKPSELTPLVLLRARAIADAAGVPAELFQVVTGDGATGAALLDAGVDKVVFTGAVATGRRVAAACGERLIPCDLELGGKAPLIACDDCDLDHTARAIVNGGFANAGQACIAVERVLANERVHDALVARVVAQVRALRLGDPASEAVDVGALILPRQAAHCEELIRDAVEHGATVAVGGRRREGRESFLEPTVLVGCTLAMRVMHEEIFGPVVPVMKVRDDDQAVRIANASPLGLNAYVFSRDRARAQDLAEKLEAGSVLVNDVLSNYATPEVPFGGVKHSGTGRVHGHEGLRGMCHAQHVSLERFALPVREPWFYPHTPGKYRALKGTLHALFGRHGLLGKLSDLF
jgi:succinate-semialdehyde dehydrogenase/glutarate-semialdehyde dehydrogenase